MSFEANLGSRMTASKYDVPKTDLDFYARPENYEGSNIHTLNKFVLTKKKQETKNTDRASKDDDPMTKLFNRYKGICDDDDKENVIQHDSEKDVNTHTKLHLPNNDGFSQELNGGTVDQFQRSHTTHFGQMEERHTTTQGSVSARLYERRRSVTAPPDRQREGYIEEDLNEVKAYDRDNLMSSSRSPRPTSSKNGYISLDSFRSRQLHPALRSSQFSYELARQRFRHAIRIVLILLKWISSLTEKEDDENGSIGKTFTDIATEAFAEGELKSSGIAFDVSQFKAKKEVNISKDVKHILSIPSTHRTQEQLQIALYGLQHLKSFAEYPLHMQEKLCKVAWYQQVPPKRVIIRQGHYAENFYFILSGQAVVRILDKKSNGEIQLRTAAVMRKGTSFGELALLHHSRRTATVVSQDLVQLLTIGREDFFDIFMKVSEEDGIPEHIKFVHSLDFMRFFSLEKLLEHPEACLFHFFKRGVVIVKDSNESDWLYIVKSGSCQVMKQLKGVRPNTVSAGSKEDTNKSNKLLIKLPSLGGLGPQESKTDTGLKKHAHRPQIASALKRAIVQYDNYLVQSQEDIFSQTQPNREDNSVPANGDVPAEDVNKPSSASVEKKKSAGKPVGFSKSKYSSLNPSHSKTGSNRRSYRGNKIASSLPTTGAIGAYLERTPSIRSRASPPPALPEPKAEPPMEPVFVQVDTIKPKDVFGLSSIQFDDDIEQTGTSVSLVSNGAECIMLSKRFFSQHANEQVKRVIRHLVRPYPTEDSLQSNLQTKVDWDQFKRRLLADTVVHLPIADARRPVTVPNRKTSVPL